MKKFALLFSFLAMVGLMQDVQAQKFPGADKSPMDAAMGRNGDEVFAKVYYSRPAKNGRELFGELVPYGKVWRTGANEATEITFFQDVTIGGKPVEAGTYTLFTVPNEDSWTVILNRQLNQWGAYRYDKSANVLEVPATVGTTSEEVEHFAITFSKPEGGTANMMFAWGDVMASLPIEL